MKGNHHHCNCHDHASCDCHDHSHAHKEHKELNTHDCGCACGCSHNESGSIKEDIIKIIVCVVLLIGAILIENLLSPFWLISLILYAIPYLISGYEVLGLAIKSIAKHSFFSENLLMSIATLGAFAVGEYREAVFVMVFFCVGELFEHIASNKTRKSISALTELRPDTARVERGGTITEIHPEDVDIGDTVIVYPGERIPLDGIISFGETTLNTSALTGESLPVSAKTGERVLSSSINISSEIKLTVTEEYKDSAVARILRLVEESYENKSKQERFITRFSRVYTPIVVVLAAIIAFIPPLFTGDYQIWIYRALMCLVVSCPCAVAVSVPLTYFSGIGCASKHGILIKGSAALETLASVKTAVFDKTGTVTSGRFGVTAVYPQGVTENELLKYAASAEAHSNHPIAMSVKAAHKDEVSSGDITELAGLGISAVCGKDTLLVGNSSLMEENGINIAPPPDTGTVLYVAKNGNYIGCIVIADVIKEESKATFDALKSMGIKSFILTGDRKNVAEDVAKKLNADGFSAELLPEGKVRAIEKLMQKSSKKEKLAFLGDGINDAPCLARADIGISMGTLGSDAAIEASDAVITDDRIIHLPEAIKIARKTGMIARQNIAFSLTFKIIVLALSALGISSMFLAAFADSGVLVLAVLNAIRASFKSK